MSERKKLAVYIQEAYFRGYVQGASDARTNKIQSKQIIEAYKRDKRSIIACIREQLKRIGIYG